MTSEPSGLVRATRLPPAFDLLAACSGPDATRFLFERMGLGVGSPGMSGGIAEAVEPPAPEAISELGRSIQRRLRALDAGPDAPTPVAVGRIDFGPGGRAWLHAPSRLVRRSVPGTTWLIEILSPDGAGVPFEPQRPMGVPPAEPFSTAQVRDHPPPEEFEAMVAVAVDRIRGGSLRKVVLARTKEVVAGRDLDPVRLAHRLRAVDPQAFAFIAPDDPGPGDDAPPAPVPSLVGASPELLLSKRGLTVRSTPLAGSAPRSGDPGEDRANADALLASPKNREEHAIVVEAIDEVLGPFCESLVHDPEPVLMETANVWHLATRFDGVLRDPAPTVVELVAALHPTPAVAGTPTAAARAAIAELEPFDRGGYAGPVGWMDADGDGEWAIALRCARLVAGSATLFAGAGIVADSRPADELEETERKFRAFLDSLRWG